MNGSEMKPSAPPEQLKYADLLFYGCWSAIFLLFITYGIYVAGILPPHVPLGKIPEYWSHSVHHYVEGTNAPLGWGWIHLLHRGDFLNFIGIVTLAGLTIVGYLSLILAYLEKRDTLFLIIAVLEVLVLLLAASGILIVGH
jgi:hypothetical protein